MLLLQGLLQEMGFGDLLEKQCAFQRLMCKTLNEKVFFYDSLNAMPCYQKTLKYNLYSISYVISKQKFEMKLMKLVDATFTF